MGSRKKQRKILVQHAQKKRIAVNDDRVREAQEAQKKAKVKKKTKQEVKEIPKAHSSLFFQYNLNLRPPYQLLVDTNFINMSIQMKLDVFQASMQCLLAKCVPCITDCVMGELEKMGAKYRLALRLAKDPRFQRLSCQHKGTYADDCLCDRVSQHKCYIVCTNDRDLKRRIRKIPGIPIMSVARGMYKIERVPDQISTVPLKGKGALKM
mmetsp:Transcript_69175/g.165871  ORF Transcript_69175/g.165871 Transcript_69175/m.165871 type:complete len:209 (+) Transcript_69175:46-672(+)